MKQYMMAPSPNEGKNWDVIERPTSTVVASSKPYQAACATVRMLNRGTGFNGYTPNFFTKTIVIPADEE